MSRFAFPMVPAFSVALALCVSACGKGLNGTYIKCYQLNTATSRQATYIIPDSSNFTYQSQTYVSSDCTGSPTPQPTSAGTYTEASSTVSGAQDINFAFGSGALNGTTLYQIFKIDSNNLFLGDASGSNNGSSDALRPTSLEGTAFLRQ